MAILFTILLNLNVYYACEDNGIDAIFPNRETAEDYVAYFKDHHSYKIRAILVFGVPDPY